MIRDLSSLHKPKSEDAENFAAQVPQEKTERTGGFYVALALDGLTLAFALWMGVLYANFLTRGESLLALALVATAFGACLSLGLYLVKNTLRRAGIIAGSTIGFFIFALSSENISFGFVAVPVTLLLIFWGEALARARIANSIRVRFLHDARPLLAKTATALVAGGVILFIPHWTPARAFFSQPSFDSLIGVAAGTLERLYSEINFKGTLEEFEQSFARYQLSRTADFRRLPPARQEEVVRNVTASLKEEFGKALRVSPSEERASLSSVLYKVTLRSVGDLQTQFGPGFLAVWLIALFFALRAVAVVFSWIAGFLAHFLFHFFLVAKVIRFRGETETREVVEYV
ncbi:MAG: hypothetical protein HYW65_03990 [Candidatus Liptonbacteria bacterium]|nr:hypothetical protein [Candidatus Liptonbacteria bacterium]